MMPMYMKGVCVCVFVKRFCGPVYVLVDLAYISQHCGAQARQASYPGLS